jgi:hypothetical protein
LTAKVETGAKYGAVMAYDGTGMTAGLDQHVAVYPRELSKPDDGNNLDDQGTLWKLLRRIEMISVASPSFAEARANLWDALSHEVWYLAQDGVLRSEEDGEPVGGKELRQVFTPHDGKVVALWQRKQAAFWAERFHELLCHPATFRAQVEYGKEHLVKRSKRRKLMKKYKGLWVSMGIVADVAYDQEELTMLQVDKHLSPELDLALCMYQAHSVNAPAIANRALREAFNKTYNPASEQFPWVLIKKLGNSKYGRWDDDLKNGRYQRTRAAARKSGLWPKSFFDGIHAIMPKDLPG